MENNWGTASILTNQELRLLTRGPSKYRKQTKRLRLSSTLECSASEMGRLYKPLTTMRAVGHKCSACLFNVSRLKYFVFMKLSLADKLHRDINICDLFSTSGREGVIQMRGHLFMVGKSKEAYHNLASSISKVWLRWPWDQLQKS